MPGWRDLVLDRITEDESGGGFTPDFFTRSISRRAKYPGVSDPLNDLGPLGNADAFNGRMQEEPIKSPIEPWRPSNNRRSGMTGYDEQGPAMNRYLQHIQEVPRHEDYSPSIWHRIVGGLAGGVEGGTRGAASGFKTAQGILDLPYQRAREDYELKGSALESAAKIEDATRKTRQAYEKQLTEAEDRDADREVKWANNEISKLKADAAIQRTRIQDEIRLATNEATAQRLRNQLARYDQQHQEAVDRLEIAKTDAETRKFAAQSGRMTAGAAVSNAASNAIRANAYGSSVAQTAATGARNAATGERRATAYENYIRQQGQPKPVPQTQIAAARGMAESETRNAHMQDTPNEPAWFDAQGYVKPEYAELFEREVQERIARKIREYGDIQIEPDIEPGSDWEVIK